jgi:hypothetical protein
MKDCNEDIENYFRDCVKLSEAKKTDLTKRREANRQRLKDGLKRDTRPAPLKFVIQGSRAMGTTIKEPGNTQDIDDGVVFAKADLVGERGAEMAPLDVRKMVGDAVDDGSFKIKPEVRTNCVRVHYNDGPHVDLPVYRQIADGSYELASSDWKQSDPEGVNDWFDRRADAKLGEGATQQFRMLIQLQKSFCVNRPSYSLPSGFALTVLTDEAFTASDRRLDQAYRDCIQQVHSRLVGYLFVRHPVVAENLAQSDDPKCRAYRDLLATAKGNLKVLDKNNCLRSEALNTWRKVFNTDYFDSAIAEAEEDEKKKASAAVASLPFVPKPWCA